jgi:serine/threonine protein kinase
MAKMRAPEEHNFNPLQGKSYIDREKTDVWALGNMIYNVLTNKWVFEGMTTGSALQRIMSAKHSKFPSGLITSKDDKVQAMLKAIEMAWTFDPKDRPTARQIAEYLKGHLNKSRGDDYWRVSIPPFPRNFRRTDSDFMASLQF